MKIWEYKAAEIMGTNPISDLISYEKLNALGKEGWELFSLGDTSRTFTHRQLWGVFKRQTDESVVGKVSPKVEPEKDIKPKVKPKAKLTFKTRYEKAHKRPPQEG